MEEIVTKFYDEQPLKQYEASHEARIQYLIEDLQLNQIENSRIGDFGCGLGTLFNRMRKDKGNVFYGIDGADISSSPYKDDFTFFQADLNLPFADVFLAAHGKLNYGLCFETLEHLPNPYSCITEIKKCVEIGGVIEISIPHIKTSHNTLYPALLYAEGAFEQFLGQMALRIKSHRVHSKAFVQNVYTCINLPWSESKMLFYNPEPKFRNIPPIVAVNL